MSKVEAEEEGNGEENTSMAIVNLLCASVCASVFVHLCRALIRVYARICDRRLYIYFPRSPPAAGREGGEKRSGPADSDASPAGKGTSLLKGPLGTRALTQGLRTRVGRPLSDFIPEAGVVKTGATV